MINELDRIAYGYLTALREQEQAEALERAFYDAATNICKCRPDMGVPLGTPSEKRSHVCKPSECDPRSEKQCIRAGWLPPNYRVLNPDVWACRRWAVHHCVPGQCRGICIISGRERRKAVEDSIPRGNASGPSYASRRSTARRAALQEDDAEQDGGEDYEEMVEAEAAQERGVGQKQKRAAASEEEEEEDGGGEGKKHDASEEGVDLDAITAAVEAAVAAPTGPVKRAEKNAVPWEGEDYGMDAVEEDDVIFSGEAMEGVDEPVVAPAAPEPPLDDEDGEEEDDESSASTSVTAPQQRRTMFAGNWDIANTSVLGMKASVATGSSGMRGAFNKMPTPKRSGGTTSRRKRENALGAKITSASTWADVPEGRAVTGPLKKSASSAASFSLSGEGGCFAGLPATRALLHVPVSRSAKKRVRLDLVGGDNPSNEQQLLLPIPPTLALTPTTTTITPYKKHRMSMTDRVLSDTIQGVIKRLFFTTNVRALINTDRQVEHVEELNMAYQRECIRMLRAKRYPNGLVATCLANATVPGPRLYSLLEWAGSEGPTYVERLRRAWRVAERVGWVRNSSRNLSVDIFVLGMFNMMRFGWKRTELILDGVSGGGEGDTSDIYLIRPDPFVGKHLPRSDDLARFGFARIVCDGEKIMKNMLIWIHQYGADRDLVDALSAAAPTKAALPVLT